MKKRPFGDTGLQVSELVLGAGYVGGIVLHADDDTRRALIRRLLDGGVNWIDTAQNYGDGRSEEALGWLLAELPAAERPYVSTKFTLDLANLDDIPGQIEAALAGSLNRLGMDRVTLYQLHNPLGEGSLDIEHVLRPGGVCDALDGLRQRGLIGHTGFTALGDPAQCRQLIESGRMASAQVYYNLLNPSAGQPIGDGWSTSNFDGLIEACADNGVAVMNIRTFAAGVLASPIEHGREIPITANAELAIEQARARQVFDLLGDRYGSGAQTALRFGLANAGVSCIVIGLAELAHLEEALAGAAMGPLPDEAIEQLRPLWASDFAE
ncbi:MAG: aldo/keto reductase [Alphaproteobacteria bacterium]|jgi:L-galactose dehydrogenase/L-glyceraldehyde 3-phosphate reductase|nr:aldo/keto reductase [Alphaproteobacteria bacterium]MDP6814634.1 aldo/keto reductase [Alphaproteobacteria bacterium]